MTLSQKQALFLVKCSQIAAKLWVMCGALVESMPFVRRVMGSTPALAATHGPWASPSLTVACGASACNSGTVSVVCGERL